MCICDISVVCTVLTSLVSKITQTDYVISLIIMLVIADHSMLSY
jgi:hypothetical protein